MAKVQIFANSIITENFENAELESEIFKELKIQEKIGGRQISNFGGFQSNGINNKIILQSLGKKTTDLLLQNYNIKSKEIWITDLWINQNLQKDFNIVHIHEGSHFSGVYYLQVPKENGELVFLREDSVVLSNLNKYISNNSEFIHNYYIKPKKNLLVLFPSYLRHCVLPHKEKCARVSVSFNVKFKNG